MSNTLTPNLKLEKPDYQAPRWDNPVNRNWDKLDRALNHCGGGRRTLSTGAVTGVALYKHTGSANIPSDIAVVAKDTSVVVYDISVDPPVIFKSFTGLSGIKTVAMAEGILVWGSPYGGYDFNLDSALNDPGIVNTTVNAVAAKSMSGRACIAVATDGGVSVVNGPAGPNTVVNMTSSHTAYQESFFVHFAETGGLFYTFDSAAGGGRSIRVQHSIPIASLVICDNVSHKGASDEFYYKDADQTDLDPLGFSKFCVSDDAFGNSSGLTVLKRNPSNPKNGLAAFITDKYSTGWMPGDIKLAIIAESAPSTLSGGTLADRSNANTSLDVVGTLTLAPVNTGCELQALSGFSAGNYLSHGPDPSFHYGTADFAFICWLMPVSSGYIIQQRKANNSGEHLSLYFNNGKLVFYATGMTALYIPLPGPTWFHCAVVRTSLSIDVYINGVKKATGSCTRNFSASDLSTAIGSNITGGTPLTNGKITLFRISKSSIAENKVLAIYDDEKKMFEEDATCTIQGSSGSVLSLTDTPTSTLIGTADGVTELKRLVTSKKDDTPNVSSMDAASGSILLGTPLLASFLLPYTSICGAISELKHDMSVTLKSDGTVPLASGYTPTSPQDIATKKTVDDAISAGGVSSYAVAEERYPSGTIASGSMVAGWNTRALNTEVINSLPGFSLDVNSGEMRLDAGHYRVHASGAFYGNLQVIYIGIFVNGTMLRRSINYAPVANSDNGVAEFNTIVTIAADNTALELKQYFKQTGPYCNGTAANDGNKELYASLMIERV